MKSPNLFIVGAPKSGTTSLYHHLSGHPDVFMSTPKEINYFSKEELEEQNFYYNSLRISSITDYETLFKYADNKKVVGEASVSYLFYPEVPAKIYAYNPKAKIIILLRNPIQRAFSHYLMDRRLGYINVPFENVIFQISNNNIALHYQQYIELGLYYDQVKRYLDIFGNNQVRIFLTEDLKSTFKKVLKNIYDFLDISSFFPSNFNKKYNVYNEPTSKILKNLYSSNTLRSTISLLIPNDKKDSLKNLLFSDKNKPSINLNTKEHLMNIYKPDIIKLESLISRDLSSWYTKVTEHA